MFSCFKSCTGSGQGKAKKSGWLGRFWRRLIRPFTHSRHASHRESKVCSQDEQEPDTLPKRPQFNYNSREYILQMVHYIPAAVQNQDQISINIFLDIYQNYATTWEVLDLLMRTYASFRHDCIEDRKTKRAIFHFLYFWMQKFPQDFNESQDIEVAEKFFEYLTLDSPGSEELTQAWEQFSLLENTEAIELKIENDCAATEQQHASRVPRTVAVRPASVAEPRGDLQPHVENELLERTPVEHYVPEPGPVQLATFGQTLPASADTQSHGDVAADEAADEAEDVAEDVAAEEAADEAAEKATEEPADDGVDAAADVAAEEATEEAADEAADEAAVVSPARHSFISYTVQLGTPDFVFPLPEVDI